MQSLVILITSTRVWFSMQPIYLLLPTTEKIEDLQAS